MNRLNGKKIIIYGDERYTRDFLYVFNQIKPSYIVNDQADDYSVSWTSLAKENINEIFVIVCKYDDELAEKNLQSIGMLHNINYLLAITLFKELDFPLKKIAAEKKVYVWGTGANSYEFFTNIIEKSNDINIAGCIDSNKCKTGKTFFGYKVNSPEQILGKKDIFIIIASKKYFWEIKDTIINHGYTENKDFVNYLEINNFASLMMKETIYDIPKLDYVCHKPFKAAELKPEGKLLICGGMPFIMDRTVPMYYSDLYSVWHCNVLKVLRLSFINGTYTFCNHRNCSYIESCGNQEFNVNEISNYFHYTDEQLKHVAQKDTLPIEHIFNRDNYKIQEMDYPETIQCGWDETCNLHCPSCRNKVYAATKEQQVELSTFSERVKKEMMSHASRIKVAGLGETFASNIYKDIIFDYELAKKINCLGIISNGSLFTKDKFDELSKMWNKINIFISMDGYKKETIEKLRAGIAYETWYENMQYIGEMKKQGKINLLAFNFVVQRENFREMPDFLRMCLGFNADQVKFSKVFNWGNCTPAEFKNITMFDDNNEMLPELKEVVSDEIFSRPEVHLFRWIEW